MSRAKDDHAEVWQRFHEAVNMAPAEIEDWLDTDASKTVGFKRDGGESVGHASGRRIVQILRTHKDELDGADYAHMRKVVGFVRRHLAQGGPHDEYRVPGSRWRASLMNWGHDPLKG